MKKAACACLSIFVAAVVLGQSQSAHPQLKELSIDFMLRGYFYAGSTIADKDAFGGFGTSDNLPKQLGTAMTVSYRAVSLIADPHHLTVFDQKYKGMSVLLINPTNQPVAFFAEDSRLAIIQEAMDRNGKWKPIEYLPHSWCGNSYHKVILGAREYWEFTAPVYTGKVPTKLRFRLDQTDADGKTTTLYSNEFAGSVNLKQFSIHQGHKPNGIMDPYID
jgi:hypothetical protein